jgi:hypothetical protein
MLNLTELLGRREGSDRDAIAAAQTELRHLRRAAGGVGHGEEVNAIQRLIADGEDAEALERAAAMLDTGNLLLEGRILITGLELECLARLGRWSQTRAPLEFLREANDGTPFLGADILEGLMNGALGAVVAAIDDDPDARAFLREVMAATDGLLRSGVQLTAGAGARLAAMRGLAATLEGDEEAARRAAADFHLPDLERSATGSTSLYRWMHFTTRRWLTDRA